MRPRRTGRAGRRIAAGLVPLAALLSLAPAWARDFPFDLSVVRDCAGMPLAALAGSALPDCVGRAAKECQTPEHADAVGVGLCMLSEQRVWEAVLAEQLDRIRQACPTNDLPGDCFRYLNDLSDAQANWQAFRDSDCVVQSGPGQSGDPMGYDVAQCRLQMTARRVFQLRAMHDRSHPVPN